jgi:hypothetical protein
MCDQCYDVCMVVGCMFVCSVLMLCVCVWMFDGWIFDVTFVHMFDVRTGMYVCMNVCQLHVFCDKCYYVYVYIY